MYDSTHHLLGIMAPPLRKWGTSGYVGGEINVVLPMQAVLEVAEQVIGEKFAITTDVWPLSS